MLGRPLVDLADVDDEGKVQPVVTIVTDNGGPFRSFRFEAPITAHPARHWGTLSHPPARITLQRRRRRPLCRPQPPDERSGLAALLIGSPQSWQTHSSRSKTAARSTFSTCASAFRAR